MLRKKLNHKQHFYTVKKIHCCDHSMIHISHDSHNLELEMQLRKISLILDHPLAVIAAPTLSSSQSKEERDPSQKCSWSTAVRQVSRAFRAKSISRGPVAPRRRHEENARLFARLREVRRGFFDCAGRR